MNGLTGRTGVGTTHERKKRLARGQFPRLLVVRQGDVHAFARVRIRLLGRPETYIFANNVKTQPLPMSKYDTVSFLRLLLAEIPGLLLRFSKAKFVCILYVHTDSRYTANN